MTQEHDAETVRILQCPFCGGQASMSKSYDPDTSGAFHHIQCHKCRAKGGEFYAVETCPIFYGQVRDAWNAREVTGWQPIWVLEPDQWGWWAGCNEEWLAVGPCSTRQHAIDEMVDYGSGEYLDKTQDPPVWMNAFYIVEAKQDPLRIADWIGVDWILERADEALADSGRVSCEYDDGPWFDATKEQELDLANRLKRACDEWQIAHALKFTSNTFSHSRNSEKVNTPSLRALAGDKT